MVTGAALILPLLNAQIPTGPGGVGGGSEPVSVCLEMRICGDYVFFWGRVGDGGPSVGQSLRLSVSVSFFLSLSVSSNPIKM